MRVVPLIAGLVATAALAPALLKGLEAGRHLRTNFRGAALPCPFGLVIVLGLLGGAALTSLVAVAFDDPDALPGELAFVLGVAFLGLVDDQFTGQSRGMRGHLAAVRRGELSTGALKAAGTLALAVTVVAAGVVAEVTTLGRALLAVAVLVLATNLFNLLDLRPGRTLKPFVLVAVLAACFVDADELGALGLLVGPVLVAGVYDLRERAMLGDTGSNVVGAVAGILLVAAAGGSATALGVTAGVLALITLYGELRSINALVESTPVLKHLDSLGRPA
ncbi:hypothetical protein [Conexibacter sp. SYSU D00693]|uniref:hypothetical protein n=1 Tax=Conexibacter sp. SYSU D00693 TaxID=2812560 RepID=UPI00196A4F96|nr:hypothetical protein [Conexibacter sp. SYSU D00693]